LNRGYQIQVGLLHTACLAFVEVGLEKGIQGIAVCDALGGVTQALLPVRIQRVQAVQVGLDHGLVRYS